MNDAERRKYFEKAVEFIGEDWLKERDTHLQESDTHRDPPTPVQQYHRALRELNYVNDEFDEHFHGISRPTLRIINLGRFVAALEDSAAIVDPVDYDVIETDVSTRFSERLRDRSEFEKTAYEIRTGALYAQRGHTVQFIDETNDKKTPDILLRTPFKVFVECKRVDGMGGDAKKQESVTKELNERAVNHILPGHVVLYDYNRRPRRDETSDVAGQIPQSVPGLSTVVQLPFGTVTLYNINRILDGTPVWLPSTGNRLGTMQKDLYDIYIAPIAERVFGEEMTTSDLSFKMRMDCNDTDDTGPIEVYTDFRFSGAPVASGRDYVTRVARQVSRAYGKFGKDTPNIVHIDTPFPAKKAEDHSDEVREAIGGELASTRRVTAVTLTLPVTEASESSVTGLRHQAASIRHFDPYTDLPKSFDLLGNDIT